MATYEATANIVSPYPSSKKSVLHGAATLADWDKYISLISDSTGDATVSVSGTDLDIGSILAVARNLLPVSVSQPDRERLWESVNAVQACLDNGEDIYGVNTGFGGSADTRNSNVQELQQAILREMHCGVIVSSASIIKKDSNGNAYSMTAITTALESAVTCEDAAVTTCMPLSWTRATILVRINSIMSGHSGVRPAVLDRILDLLNFNIIPRIPLRGSISASGDLIPLSYVGGAIQGKPSISVHTDHSEPEDVSRSRNAHDALAANGLDPVYLDAKESLALMNGTAASCGAAVLALHDANQLALLSQVLAAMSVEGLKGNSESFDSFFSELRPHPGQVEAAANIHALLKGSKLIKGSDIEADELRQDRYSIRTAPQWIGPVLEDLLLARQQLVVESNSVTDNPLINDQGEALHGGNFQARAVTSAMEKTRQGLQTMGRMLFAQVTELINPATNYGLPPNLVMDEPSISFLMKPLDIQSAALISELGFLANPAGTHVQTAEMGNQALNSLALISARYTQTAVDVLTMLAAGHILALCQAFDIRAMNSLFFAAVESELRESTQKSLAHVISRQETDKTQPIAEKLWSQFQKSFDSTASMDTEARFNKIGNELRALLLDEDLIVSAHQSENASDASALMILSRWRAIVVRVLIDKYNSVRHSYLSQNQRASDVLGLAARRVYGYVRDDLEIPVLTSSVLREQHGEPQASSKADTSNGHSKARSESITVGSCITKIYLALRKGPFYQPIMESIREVQRNHV